MPVRLPRLGESDSRQSIPRLGDVRMVLGALSQAIVGIHCLLLLLDLTDSTNFYLYMFREYVMIYLF